MSESGTLSLKEGMDFLPNLWLMSFKHAPSSWEAYQRDKAQRDCAIIAPTKDGTNLEVTFCTDDAELAALWASSAETTLYGQYNQHNVCHLTVKGKVVQVADNEATVAKEALHAKLCGGGPDRLRNGLDEEERKARLKLISSGAVFRFVPDEYKFYQYERG